LGLSGTYVQMLTENIPNYRGLAAPFSLSYIPGPWMHCANCEKKIKENIRFEKGIKSITTNLKDKTVTVEYDADKTNVQNIINGFKKINYDAKEVKTGATKKE
jgi:copper chaperone CopZ